MDLPDSLRFIKRFLIQANQVERSKHPLIAYYLRLYAVTLALKLPKEQRDPSIMLHIGHLMDELEKLKGKLDELDKEKDRISVEEFAAQLFDFADKTDRAGKATKNTALGFSASSVVFECLEYFGPLEPEVFERIRYAKWKAADISKALKNGQTPTPGPYNQLESAEDIKEIGIELPPAYNACQENVSESSIPIASSSAAVRSEPSYKPPDVPSFRSTVSAVPSAPASSSAATRRLSLDDEKKYYAMIMDAEKKTSHALASLRFKDWNGAEALLSSALDRVRSIKALEL